MHNSYSVIYTGKTHRNFQYSDIANDFSALFKLTQDKATIFLESSRVVKKDLDLKSATAYKNKLEAIGLIIELKKQEPVAATLTLEPTEHELNARPEATDASATQVTCPKCNLEQPKVEQCTGCGVFMHKVPKPATTLAHIDDGVEDGFDEDLDEDAGPQISKPIIAATLAAIAGAFLWKFIAVFFGYELGLIAWLIGGMVGFSAAALGSRAPMVGVACGLLALLAILGGKYMAVEAMQASWVEEMSTWTAAEEESLRYEYEAVVEASKVYAADVNGELSLRQFMVDYGYSEEYEAEDVSIDEITDFKANIQPELETMAYSKPDFEAWMNKWVQSVEDEFENLSTFDLMQENFGFLDILFLFLGISTAFRLGKGH